jgi:glycosyltransferase involved in cell wall biosynthesis
MDKLNSNHDQESTNDSTVPKVSVLMSVYNGASYLRQSVQSILDQTFLDFEFIIVNDGSTDNTQEILESVSDPRVQVLMQPNTGLTKALNRGLKLCRGEFIARMDADDLSMPERLERQLIFFDKHPEVGMVGTAYFEIDDNGRVLSEKACLLEDNQLRKVLIKYNPFCHTSTMIRKSVLSRVGFYDESFPYAQDYELWFRIAKHYKLANLPQFLTKNRIRDDNISFAFESQQLKYAIKARRKEIQSRHYPIYLYYYLLWPLIVMNVPASLRTWIRRNIIRKSRKRNRS